VKSKFVILGLVGLLMVGVVLIGSGCDETADPPPPAAATPTPLPTDLMGPEPVEVRFDSPAYGIHTFLWWKPDIAQRDLQLVQEMGFGWVKQKFSWRDIEGIQKGSYDWFRPDLIVDMVEEAGLQLVVRLDQQPLWSVEMLPPGTDYHQPAAGRLPGFWRFLRSGGRTLSWSHCCLPGVERAKSEPRMG
jgi:hypothetical protein